jgi:hypothetical protein
VQRMQQHWAQLQVRAFNEGRGRLASNSPCQRPADCSVTCT